MSNKIYDADVIEDNGGGLHLYVLDGDRVVWAHDGYEYRQPGDLTADLNFLSAGDDPATDWDGGIDNPQEVYEKTTSYEYGWKVVATLRNGEIEMHTDLMGAAAQREFGVSSDN